MPIVNLITWPTSNTVKKKLMEEITRVIYEVCGTPLDKITIYIQEINKENWADAGVLGVDADFSSKSRRMKYED